MKPIIIKDLNHYFGKDKLVKQALFDINLEIEAGEIIIMTGPSGSGKTTLLTLLGGLRKVESGSLQTLGQELFQAKEPELVKIRRNIGYIFQAHNLLPFMTAQQNVQMSLELDPNMTSRKAASIAREMLIDVGLQERTKYFPENLSGGQKQRVAIARALASQPKLVLADEPTAALDSKTGREIVNIMHRLVKEQNSTILLVTHDNRILDIADRIIHMEDGRLVNTEKRSGDKKVVHLHESNRDSSEKNLLPVATNARFLEGKNESLANKDISFPSENFKVSSRLNDNHCGDHLVTSIPDQQTSSLLDKNDSLTSNVEQEYYTYTHKDYESPVAFKKRTYNVVCIDDSSTYLKLVKLFLDNNIFNIITIDNAVDALVETVKNKPDIILLDIMMADIDGHEFCKLLRQSKTFQNTPVIMMTSLNDPKNRELAEINGASDYLAKPFNKTDLLKILFKFL